MSPPTVTAKQSVVAVLFNLFDNYKKTTSAKLKIIDAYMFYILITGIAQVGIFSYLLQFNLSLFCVICFWKKIEWFKV